MREFVKDAKLGEIRPRRGTARPVAFLNLKPTRTAIQLRIPDLVLARVKSIANRRGVHYHALLTDWIAERAEKDKAPF